MPWRRWDYPVVVGIDRNRWMEGSCRKLIKKFGDIKINRAVTETKTRVLWVSSLISKSWFKLIYCFTVWVFTPIREMIQFLLTVQWERGRNAAEQDEINGFKIIACGPRKEILKFQFPMRNGRNFVYKFERLPQCHSVVDTVTDPVNNNIVGRLWKMRY